MQQKYLGRDEVGGVEVFMRQMLATILPYGIVFGSVLLKLPQIVKILRNHSADGISIISLVVELMSCVISSSWGIARSLMFKDYGESTLIMIEMFLLLLIVGCMQRELLITVLVFIVAVFLLVFMSAGYAPRNIHEGMLRLQIFFALGSRIPQIVINYQNKSTGQLSALTFFLAMSGGISRLLTTFHNIPSDKGRDIMLTQFGVVVFLNFVIVMQCILYKAADRRQVGTTEAKAVVKKNN